MKLNKRIKTFLRDFFLTLKIIPLTSVLSKYLANGVYSFRNEYIKKRAFVFPMLVICSRNKNKIIKEKSCYIYFGGRWETTVAIVGELVIKFMHTKYDDIYFDNMQKYLPECNYPKCEYFYYNYKKRYNVSIRVDGSPLDKNAETFGYYVNEIAKYNRNAKKYYNHVYDGYELAKYNKSDGAFFSLSNKGRIQKMFDQYGIDNLISYVQHGDLAHLNILKNGENIKVIDFDTINVFPCFYDIIRYILNMKNGLKTFFEGGFDHALSYILEGEGIKLTLQEKDKYMAAFWIINLNCWHHWLTLSDVPDEYVITKKVLSDNN